MSAPSIWVEVTGWFTPTVLFVALNIVIGTIAVTSKTAHRKEVDDGPPNPQLSRAPFLERVRSFNLNFYRYNDDNQYDHHAVADSGEVVHVEHHQQQQPALYRRPSLLERIKSFTISPYGYRPEETTQETIYSPAERTEAAEKKATTMEEVHRAAPAPAVEHISRRRSATDSMLTSGAEVMETKLKKFASDNLGKDQFDDDEVDARADHFISKFRQQLKFPRLESIRRYTEMLKRGVQ